MQSETLYLGAAQVTALNPGSWVGHQGLPPSFRITSRSIYQLVSPGTLEIGDTGEIDTWLLGEFRRIGFEVAEPQEMWRRHSFFDPIYEQGYDEYEHDKKLEEAIARIRQNMGHETGELMESAIARIDEFDFRLSAGLASAVERWASSDFDSYRHVATTCRIMLEFLADTVYPPRDITDDGHKAGRDK